MNKDWMIRPKEGLGAIQFGMTEAQITQLAEPYGERTSRRDLGAMFSADEMPQVQFDQMVEFLGEEEALATLEVMRDADAAMSGTTQVIYGNSLKFTVGPDGLNDIMCNERAGPLHYNGKAFFKVDPVPALQDLQRLNGAPPLVKGPDCHFKAIEVTAWQCIMLMPYPLFRATMEGTEEADQKTIGWRNSPRNQGEDFSGHQAVDLLP